MTWFEIASAAGTSQDATQTLFDFYDQSLRASFFTGFLTVATFLFAVKTHVIFKLKDSLYDSDHYKDRFQRLIQRNSDLQLYGPLRRFGTLLISGISLALLSAGWQLAAVWIRTDWSAVVGIGLAIVTLLFLALCIAVLAMNLRDWFNSIEEAAKAERNESPGESG